MNTRHLSHKTADVILDNDFKAKPLLSLWRGTYPLHEEFQSLIWYVNQAARVQGVRLKVYIGGSLVTIARHTE